MAGTIVADTLQDGAGNSTAMDNAIYGSAKAWATFNATAVVNASYNVSSITKNSAGNFTLNFTTAITDVNYAVIGSALGGLFSLSPVTNTTTTCNFVMYFHSFTTNGVPTATDSTYNSIVIHR